MRPSVLLGPLILLAACVVPEGEVGDVEHVVVAVIDGVRMAESFAEGTLAANGVPSESVLTEVREALLPEGALVRPAYNLGVTITAPGHCALATGRRVPIGNFPAEDGVGYYVPDVPTLFERLPGPTWTIGNTGLFAAASWSAWPGLGATAGARFVYLTDGLDGPPVDDDGAVLDETLATLRQTRSPLLLANLHAMDRAGHYGANGDYLTGVRAVDAPLVEFWRTLQADRELGGRTVLLVIADHGRHDNEADPETWRGHGDACRGCREIPMLWLGPGIRQGVVTTEGATLEDAGATIAWLLGTTLPLGEGRVLTEILEAPVVVPPPLGPIEVAAVPGVRAARILEGGASAVQVTEAGAPVLTTDALHAEGPVLVSSAAGVAACWRALPRAPFAIEGAAIPWAPRCWLRRDGAWQDLGFPLAEVSPAWSPALSLSDTGVLSVASSDNATGTVADATIEEHMSVWTWDGAWLPAEQLPATFSFASHASLAGDVLALAASQAANDTGRDTRHVEVWRRSPEGWAREEDGVDTSAADGTLWPRHEYPALNADGTELVFVGYGPGGTTLLSRSWSLGGWSTAAVTDPTGRVLPHVRPQWVGEEILYARLAGADAGDTAEAAPLVEACLVAPGGAPRCTGLGEPWVGGVAWQDGLVLATVSSGDGAWALRELPAP